MSVRQKCGGRNAAGGGLRGTTRGSEKNAAGDYVEGNSSWCHIMATYVEGNVVLNVCLNDAFD